jgi:hypothetical protein
MAHGYLREYDEGWDRGDERREQRERGDWRERDPVWREDREGERGRGFMLNDEERARRGGFEGDYRADESWARDQGGFGGAGDWHEGRRSFSAHPDDHYRSWRDRHMQELDRDYQDYCREREQAFHRDFEAWRLQRHGNPQPVQPGMTQSGLWDTTGTLDLTNPAPVEAQPGPDPTATATLGTNSSGRTRP